MFSLPQQRSTSWVLKGLKQFLEQVHRLMRCWKLLRGIGPWHQDLGFVYFILFVPFPMSLNCQISIIVRYKVIKIGTWGSSGVITSEAESLISRPLCLLISSHFYSLARVHVSACEPPPLSRPYHHCKIARRNCPPTAGKSKSPNFGKRIS